MSKKSIICTIVALALVLVGTGYAYWADKLTVTTKATTGDMEVKFLDLGLYAQYGNEQYNVGNWSIIDGIGDTGFVSSEFFARGSSDYNKIAKDGSIEAYKDRAEGFNEIDFNAELVSPTKIPKSIDGYAAGVVDSSDNIVLTINKMYPGYAQAFRSDIGNFGSIAAKLSDIKMNVSTLDEFDLSDEVKNMLGVAVLVEREYSEPGEEGASVFKLCDNLGLSADQIFELGGVHFIRLSALSAIDKEKIENAELYCLPNSNRMDIYVAVAMDPDAEGAYTSGTAELMADNDDAASQNKGAKIVIDLLWDQFNEGSNAETTNWLDRQN